MAINLPEWANNKQKEGMELIYAIANEYGNFDISFKPDDSGLEDEEAESVFYIVLDWTSHTGEAKTKRHHEMMIGFDFEATWDSCGERLHEWQFMFGNGDATREVSSEVFFLDLFFYFDDKHELVA